MSSSPAPRWSPETKRWTILAIIALAGALAYYARSALSWLVVAALLAYLLQPLVNWLQDRGVARPLAAILALLSALAVIIIIPAISLPLLINQFAQVFVGLSEAALRSINATNDWFVHSQMIHILGYRIDLSNLIQRFNEQLNLESGNGTIVPTADDLVAYIEKAIIAAGSVIGGLSTWITILLGRIISLAFSLFLMLFYTFYITVDGWKLRPWIQSQVKPEFLPELNELGLRINRVWQAFFRGQLLLSVVIGLVTLVVGLVIGLPSALALAIIAGVLEVVPTIGPVIAAIPAVILALLQGSSTLPVSPMMFALITIGAYLLIQQLENAIIVPRIMGSALELHPMVVLVGVVIGASFGGILGVFLAAPTLASLKVLLAYARAKILDLDPFPVPYAQEQAAIRHRRGPTLLQWLLQWSRRSSDFLLDKFQSHEQDD